ncbi:MAG: hypothetical protein RL328_528 [Acidobacteriota bacterium]
MDSASSQHVALVGGDTLLARELREVLEAESPAPRIHLISAGADNATILSPDDEDVAVMTPLTAEALEGNDVAFLAGSPASARRTLKLAPSAPLVDLTSSLEEQPEARLRAPSAEPANTRRKKAKLQVIAHPAAIAITTLLARLSATGRLRACVAHVFEPASERGQRGIEELRKQTVSVLSFQKLDTTVFDTQLAFNLLARYGEEAEEPLEGIEQRVEKHTASLISVWPGLPMPSIRVIQAPVFHGHSISVWVEFEADAAADLIAEKLADFGLDVRPDEPPSNANIAGQGGLSVGAITVDRNNPHACWIWMVTDNLRLTAENAAAVGKEFL